MSKARLVLDLTPLATPGGARGIGRYIRELALGLASLSADELAPIELVGLTGLQWTGRYAITSDLAAFVEAGQPRLLDTRDYYSWAYRQRFLMWNALRKLEAKAVHIGDPHATPRLLSLSGVRKIVTCHDLIPVRFPDHYMSLKDGGPSVGHWIQKQRFRSAHTVVAVSDATKSDVCSLLGVSPERVVRVYNGVAVERWTRPSVLDARAVLSRHGLLERCFVLYVGGADWRKNIEGMMAAIARVRAEGHDVLLAFAGHLESGPAARVESLARAAGIQSSIRLLGFVNDDELLVLYRSALAHLLVSRLEGFGLTVVEAMASGCPVITTAAGSLGEVAGDAALTVGAEDVEAVAAGIVRLIVEPGFGEALRARGRERAPRFSRAIQARETLAVYKRVLQI